MPSADETTLDDARRLLGVDAAASPREVTEAYHARHGDCLARARQAPSPALREKFERQAAELDAAYGRLSGAADPPEHDLPVARPRGGDATAAPAAPEVAALRIGERIADLPGGALHRATSRDGDAWLAVVAAYPSAELAGRFATVAEAWSRAGAGTDLVLLSGGAAAPALLAVQAAGGQILRGEIEEGRKVRRLRAPTAALEAVTGLGDRLCAAPAGDGPASFEPDTIWRTAEGHLAPLGFDLRVASAPSDGARTQKGLAALLWILLTNRPPTDTETDVRTVRPELDPVTARVLEKGLRGGFAALPAFVAALKGESGSRFVPRPVARLLQGMTPTQMMAGAGAVALIAVLAVTYPSWRSMTPWQGAADKREATRLAGLVKVLNERAATQLSASRQAADQAANDADRLQEKLASRSEAYEEVLPRYLEVSLAKVRTEKVRTALESSMAAAVDRTQLEAAEASSLLAAGAYRDAAQRFKTLEAELRRLAAQPDSVRRSLQAQDAAVTARFAGAWAPGDCAAASQWRVAGDLLKVTWPGQGEFEERVLGVDEGKVYTVGVQPQSYAGRHYSYVMEGAGLVAQEIGRGGASLRLRRCG